jgi:hypothetical protein
VILSLCVDPGVIIMFVVFLLSVYVSHLPASSTVCFSFSFLLDIDHDGKSTRRAVSSCIFLTLWFRS